MSFTTVYRTAIGFDVVLREDETVELIVRLDGHRAAWHMTRDDVARLLRSEPVNFVRCGETLQFVVAWNELRCFEGARDIVKYEFPSDRMYRALLDALFETTDAYKRLHPPSQQPEKDPPSK